MANEDPLVIRSEQGKIRISEEIVMTIARNAVRDIEGIESISGGFPGSMTKVFNRNTATKSGIQLEKEQDHLILNLSLEVLYGVPIPQMVESAQQKVKNAIESMTEIEVKQVNIFVHNIKTT